MQPPNRLRFALGTGGLFVAVVAIGWLDYVTGAEVGWQPPALLGPRRDTPAPGGSAVL